MGAGSESGGDVHYIGFGIVEVESFRSITKIRGIKVDITSSSISATSSGVVYLMDKFGNDVGNACMIVF